MARIKYLIIHCTATPEGREVSSAEIRAWHSARGWSQVGYTDMLHLDGRWERLADNNEDAEVDPWEVTNGAKGYNSKSRHIVYVGGMNKSGSASKDTRTVAQIEALKQYVTDFNRMNPSALILGHRDLPGVTKQCPSFDVRGWLKTIGIVQQ